MTAGVRSPLLIAARTTRERFIRLAAARTTVGLSVSASPMLAARLYGVDPVHVTPVTRLAVRLFGVRQLALGSWAAAVSGRTREQQRLCATVNAAVDAADMAVLAPLLLTAGMRRAAAIGLLLACGATAAWLEILADL